MKALREKNYVLQTLNIVIHIIMRASTQKIKIFGQGNQNIWSKESKYLVKGIKNDSNLKNFPLLNYKESSLQGPKSPSSKNYKNSRCNNFLFP
jgi:hypothetical protein